MPKPYPIHHSIAFLILPILLILSITPITQAVPPPKDPFADTRNTPESLLFGCNGVSNPHILYYPDGWRQCVYITNQRLGSRLVRPSASPQNVEKVRGQRNFAQPDAEIDEILSYGITPMLLICNSPGWANITGHDNHAYGYKPEFYGDFEDYCREVAERYKGKVHLYQIWNEPNGYGWHTHDGFNHADEYYPMLYHGYKGFKKGDPDAIVLMGSLDDRAGNGHYMLNMIYDIRKKENPGERFFDGVTLHPYDFDIKNKEQKIRRIHDIMAANGDGDLPIYVTEYGWRTSNDDKKSGCLRQTLELFQNPDLPYLKGCIHLAQSDFEGEPGFGFSNENFQPNKAFYTFQGTPRFGASPPCQIEWKPLDGQTVQITWKTVLPAKSTLDCYKVEPDLHYSRFSQGGDSIDPGTKNEGPRPFLDPVKKIREEAKALNAKNGTGNLSMTIDSATEFRATLKGFEPGGIYEFTIKTITVDGKEYETPAPYFIYMPGKAIQNSDFERGTFMGIAHGWRAWGSGLYTDGEVFPDAVIPWGAHAQVIFGVPSRGDELKLDNAAYSWFTTEAGKTYKVSAQCANVSIGEATPVLARIGLDPTGGEVLDSKKIQWGDWQTLTREWQVLSHETQATGPLMTAVIQTRDKSGIKPDDKTSRPAMMFDQVEVTAMERD